MTRATKAVRARSEDLESDPEIQALAVILREMQPLDATTRARMLAYLCARFGAPAATEAAS